MSNFPSVRPTLNLQFKNQPTPEAMLSHLKSVGATFTRDSEATYIDQLGVLRTAPAGYPRPSYDPVTGEHKGLLIEESRENLITESDLSLWTELISSDITVIAGDVLRGIQFYELQKTGATSFTGIERVQGSISPGATGVVSWLVKDVDYAGNIDMYSRDSVDSDSQRAGVKFNLPSQGMNDINSGSSIDLISSGVEDWGGGIYRVWYSFKNNYAGTRSIYHTLRYSSSLTGVSFLVALPVFEIGKAMSYTPFVGMRESEEYSMTGDAFDKFYNNSEGTIFVNIDQVINSDVTDTFLIIGNSNLECIKLIKYSNNTLVVELRNQEGVLQEQIILGSQNETVTKVAISYSPDRFKVVKNGTTITDKVLSSPFNIVTRLFETRGPTKVAQEKIHYFPKAFPIALMEKFTQV